MGYYCFLLNIKKRKYGENMSKSKEKLKEIVTVIRKSNLLEHRHISESVFSRFNIALIRLIGERYEQEKWDNFQGSFHNHIAVFQIGVEHYLVVKITRKFEVFYIMTTAKEFFYSCIVQSGKTITKNRSFPHRICRDVSFQSAIGEKPLQRQNFSCRYL